MLVSSTGAAFGIVLTMLTSDLAQRMARQVLPFAPQGSLIAMPLELPVLCLAGSVLAGLLAGLYPACRAAAVDPIHAIRSDG